MKTNTEIKELIGAIGIGVATTNEMIHVAAVNIIGHAFVHGDVTLGDDLLDATKGTDRKALTQYLTTFGPFKVNAEKGTFALNKAFRAENEYDEEALYDGIKWYEYVPDKKTVMAAFDTTKRILSVVRQAQAKADEHKDVSDLELVPYILEAVKKFNGDKAAALREMANRSPMEGGRTGTEG